MPYREHLRDCKIASDVYYLSRKLLDPANTIVESFTRQLRPLKRSYSLSSYSKKNWHLTKKNISLVCSIAEVVKLFMFPVAFLGLRLQAYLDLLQILIGYKLGCLVLFQSSTPQISKKSSNFGSVWLLLTFPVS